jgi:hypothetical protein
MADVIAETSSLSEAEFTKRHPNVAFLFEASVPVPPSDADADEYPTVADTSTELPTFKIHATRERLAGGSRIGWAEKASGRGASFLLGRGFGCDIVVPHPRISRKHATIRRSEAGTWVVEDHSSNETYLNGRPLTRGKAELLEDGDILELGQVAILRPFFLPEELFRRLRAP